MSVQTPPISPDYFVKGALDSLASSAWSAFKSDWHWAWPWLLGALAVVLAGILLQISMLRGGGRNTLSPVFNSMVGSMTWAVFVCVQFGLAYWIFGSQVVDELWFALFSLSAYVFAKLTLRGIGFWYY